jgi:citrate synthase
MLLETELSEVNGQAGRLTLRGRALEELVGEVKFDDFVDWLWGDLVADPLPLGQARASIFPVVAATSNSDLDPVDGLRLCLSACRRQVRRNWSPPRPWRWPAWDGAARGSNR